MRKVAAVVLIAVLAGLAWFIVDKRSDSDGRSTKPQAPLTPGVNEQFSGQEAQMESALVSQNAATVRSVWVGGHMPPIAPKGTAVQIDGASFVSRGNAGRVDAVVRQPGKSAVTCRLLLQRKGDTWLVYAMEEVK